MDDVQVIIRCVLCGGLFDTAEDFLDHMIGCVTNDDE